MLRRQTPVALRMIRIRPENIVIQLIASVSTPHTRVRVLKNMSAPQRVNKKRRIRLNVKLLLLG